jgi:hypothetical protein
MLAGSFKNPLSRMAFAALSRRDLGSLGGCVGTIRVADVEPGDYVLPVGQSIAMEHDMKRARTGKRAELRSVGPRTGRDGAIDHALLMGSKGRSKRDDQDHIYRVIELVGTSETSISDAINSAIARAHKTLRNLRWFEVAQVRGDIENGDVRHYQVTLKVGFTMEQPR